MMISGHCSVWVMAFLVEGNSRMDAQTAYQAIEKIGLMAGMRGAFPPEVALPVVEVLLEEGINVFEFMMNSDKPLPAMQAVKQRFGDDVVAGMGTVLGEATARRVVDAGADFIVAPSFSPIVVQVAKEAGILVAPGVMTPTEAVDAWSMGVRLLKLFPAGPLGIEYFKAVRGPLDHISFMCNGGINPDTVRQFISAGAVACGAGSWLVGDGTRSLDSIRNRAKQITLAVEEAREGRRVLQV
ncbi:MAG: 2-dehydro-3-deoxyphosphogluconate aldolase [Chloroflexi bacterium]|nr:MAG: 2-dehydro-3-deoxyphosphogluconate aldolase [Chloroflexota bacterium]